MPAVTRKPQDAFWQAVSLAVPLLVAPIDCPARQSASTPAAESQKTSHTVSASPDAATTSDSTPMRARALSLWKSGDHDRALDLMNDIIARFPNDADAIYLRATAYLDRRDWVAAIRDFRRTVDLAPDHADAWGQLSACLIITGEPAAARTAAAKAQSIAPGNFVWAANLGHVDLLEGNPRAARKWYRRAIPFIDDETTLKGSLIDFDFFIDRGWQADASRAERLTLARDWRDWQHVREMNRQIATLEEKGRHSKALSMARKALEQTRFLLGEATLAEADAMGTVAFLLMDLGRYQEAEPLVTARLAIYRLELPPEHPAIALGLNSLGVVLTELGRYEEAESRHRDALRMQRAALPKNDSDIAESLSLLGLVLIKTGRYAEGESMQREALTMLEQSLPKSDPKPLVVKNRLIGALVAKGDYAAAQSLARQVLAARRATLPGTHPDIAASLSVLGRLTGGQGDVKEGERSIREALAIQRKSLRKNHPDLGRTLNEMGNLLLLEGRFKAGETALREALAISRAAFPSKNLDNIDPLQTLASLLQLTGRYREADAMYREALDIQRTSLPRNHPDVAATLTGLADVVESTGRDGEADTLYREALAIRRAGLPAGHPNIATTLGDYGWFLLGRNRYQEAESLLREALDIERRAFPEGNWNVMWRQIQLGRLLYQWGRHAEAESSLREALAMTRSALPDNSLAIGLSLVSLADVLKDTGRYAESERLAREALGNLRASLPKDHFMIGVALITLSDHLSETGRDEEAESLLREGLQILRSVDFQLKGIEVLAKVSPALMLYKTMGIGEAQAQTRSALASMVAALPAGHSDIAAATLALGALLAMEENYAEAEPLLHKALEVYRNTLPSDHPIIVATLAVLAYLCAKTERIGEAEELIRVGVPVALGSEEPQLRMIMQWVLAEINSAKGNAGAAIFFGKQVVNTLQSLRRNLTPNDQAVQTAFVKKNEDDYRELADRLIAEGRLTEAQQVLRMLKEAEYFEFIRRDATEDPRGEIPLNDLEGEQKARLDGPGAELAKLGAELRNLRRLKVPTPEEKARIAELVKRKATATDVFERALEAVREVFEARAKDLAKQREKELDTRIAKAGSEWVGLLETLETASGRRVALVQYLAMPERLHILLTQGEVSRAVAVDVTEKDLNAAIQAFRDEASGPLRNPRLDPRPQARRLYDLLIAPIAGDLEAAGIDMLMVYLDGTLRYLPLAALYDGERWLTERYGLAVYTAVMDHNLDDVPAPEWRLAGFGVSVPHGQVGPNRRDFDALPAVPRELEGIVRRSPDDPDGSLPGQIYLDPAFTAEALTGVLGQRRFPVVHLATHFALESGDDDSFLVLGDGGTLTLRELRRHRFTGVDLATLSACDTAVSLSAHAGREIEGLGTLVQEKGAKGVIATLWPVADASTGLFMQSLYRLRAKQGLTKAEALRQAQLALMHTTAVPPQSGTRGWVDDGPAASQTGAADPQGRNRGQTPKTYAHPYYWAPFILMGNWL